MKRLNFKFVTTAGFLLSALLIAGCASQSVSEEPSATPTPTPFSDVDTSGGIHAGENQEAYAVLVGTWDLERTENTESEEPAESEQTRQFHFREDGTGYVVLAEGEEQTFEFALEGDHLTIVPEDGAVELYQCTMENATMYLTRINNDGTLQTLREVYAQSDVQPDPVPAAAETAAPLMAVRRLVISTSTPFTAVLVRTFLVVAMAEPV